MKVLTLLAATALTAGLAASPALAQAEPPTDVAEQSPSPPGHTLLSFRMTDGAEPGVAQLGWVWLMCKPNQGSHPDAAQACHQLQVAEGDFDKIEPGSGACPMIYSPVTVSAIGLWEGQWTEYTGTYSNRCVAGVQTNGVFKF